MHRLLQVKILREHGRWRLAVSVNAAEYRTLTEQRFGLGVLMTDRDDLATADLILAYRGSRAERAFQEMKDLEDCRINTSESQRNQ